MESSGRELEAARAAEPAASPALRLRRVRKRFGFQEILRGVDLELGRGECLSIFGHNGAGKSTLLRIVATQWTPSSGDVEVLGLDAAKQAHGIRERIGVVLHQSFLRAELTLEENLGLFSALYRAGDPSRQEALVERFGLRHRLRDRVGTFSQGMTKRANLIRSLLHDPELWLLDEPFAGLDPDGRSRLEEEIGEYRGRGGTVVLITHETELGERLGTRRLRMADGAVSSQEGRR